ncbi:ATP synthase B-like protein [Aphelenchoides avenae]|nr:ATP synthase B-like protein [Aphelenchus avenae]
MLSRLAPSGSGTARLVAVVPVRSASNLPATTQSGAVEPEHQNEQEPNFFQKIALRFQGIPLPGESQKPKSAFDQMHAFAVPKPLPEMPKDYKEYPERDLVNFHYPTKTLYPPKTRLLAFPDSWFTPFQKVTGTSGPYLFYGGLFAFLVNKEIWVFEENAAKLLGFIYVYVLLSRVFGHRIDKWSYEYQQQHFANLRKIIDDDLKDAVDFRKNAAAEAESLRAVRENFPTIFKENLALQLEATYRKNVATVSDELKRRLDYLREVEETKARFERDILLKSIVGGVQKAIDTNEGGIKEKYLDNCIAELKGLAARA